MTSQTTGHGPIYSLLDHTQFQVRLLTLAPDAVNDADIACRLEIVELQNPVIQEYEALSYAWGPSSPKKTITVNGQPLQIGTNLHAALRYIRSTSEPRRLWIDALCINQSDEIEKNHQIQKMGAIYSNASDVLIWLGESDGDIDRAMAVLKDMERRLDLTKLDWYLNNNYTLPSEEIDEAIEWHVPILQDKSMYPGMRKLFTKPWFSRIWVVQEAALSRHSPITLCGKWSLSFKLLWNLRHNLSMETAYGPAIRQTVGLDEFSRQEVFSFRARWSRNAHLLSKQDDELLAHFLKSTSRRQCSDPRDKIFGVLGFMSPDYIVAHFPSYNESVGMIYQRATKLLLRNDGMRTLRYAKTKTRSDLPSWCIDFSCRWVEND